MNSTEDSLKVVVSLACCSYLHAVSRFMFQVIQISGLTSVFTCFRFSRHNFVWWSFKYMTS